MINIKNFNKKLSLKSISRKHKGFSLLELILVLGISTLVGISLIQYEARRGAIIKAENAGNQLSIVGKALTSYISREIITLSGNLANNDVVTLDFNVLRGVNQVIAGKTYLGHEILPTSFQPRSSFGPTFVMQIRKRNDKIEGLIITDRPICEKDNVPGCGTVANPIKYDWIGAAIKKVGPYGGLTYNQATTMTGYNAGWQEVSGGAGAFTVINAAGLIGYRVFGTAVGDYDNIYLRLDGTSTMQGNLNMGNHNVNNVTNIQYNGWLIGNNAALNLVRSGNIYNSGNLETVNAYATNDINVGRDINVLNNVNLGNDVNVGRNVNVTNNLTVKRNTQLGEDVSSVITVAGVANFKERVNFEKDAQGYAKIGAPQMRTNDILFGNNGNVAGASPASTRTIPANMWLSDMIPRYSSRGSFLVNNGSSVNKPTCFGGSSNARVELMVQQATMRTPADGNIYVSSYTDPVTGVTYSSASHNLSTLSGFVVSKSDMGSYWIINMSVQGAPINMLIQAHTYCDLGF